MTVAAAVSLSATAASAVNIIHDRKGTFVGFGGGVGFSDVTDVRRQDLPAPGVNLDPGEQVGFMGDLRFGYAFNSSWATSFENAFWFGSRNGTRGFLSNHMLALTYFLKGYGLYGRAGAGVGRVDMEWRDSRDDFFDSADTSGFGYMFALGNEWRVNQHMAVMWQISINILNQTPGPEFDDPITFTGFTAQLNWYNAEQRPR